MIFKIDPIVQIPEYQRNKSMSAKLCMISADCELLQQWRLDVWLRKSAKIVAGGPHKQRFFMDFGHGCHGKSQQLFAFVFGWPLATGGGTWFVILISDSGPLKSLKSLKFTWILLGSYLLSVGGSKLSFAWQWVGGRQEQDEFLVDLVG